MTPYQRFVAASGLTNLADGVAVVAWAWAASLLTRDAVLVSLVAVALRLPWFVLALPAGVITDRVDRRRLIMAMDSLRAAAFAVAAGAIWWASPLPAAGAGVSVPWLYVLIVVAALVVGGAEVFRDNAAQTMLPALVPDAELERANGRLWSVELVGNALAGPALGAFLIAAMVALPFALNAVAYGLAILLVAGIAGQFRPVQAGARDWRVELRAGFSFLRGAPLLRTMAVTTGFWNLFHQMVVIALVLHAQENLGLNAQAYGLVLASGAVGGIVGSLIGPRVAQLLGRGPTMQWMLAASAPPFVAMALAPNAVVLAVAFMLFELSGLIWNIVSVSTRQRLIPDALLGRVNSIYRLLAWGMMPLGLLASGLIVRWAEGAFARNVALVLPFWVAAMGFVVLCLLAWRPLGRGFAGLDEKV
ncbi:MAG: MFS transporter [Paracoccaceae bacterium]